MRWLLRFTGGDGIRGWRLEGVDDELDGLPSAAPDETPRTEATHTNGVTRIDRRRVREAETDGGKLRQGFFRLGELILEVAEHPKERLGSVHDAVQPGRRIATVRAEAKRGCRWR